MGNFRVFENAHLCQANSFSIRLFSARCKYGNDYVGGVCLGFDAVEEESFDYMAPDLHVVDNGPARVFILAT